MEIKFFKKEISSKLSQVRSIFPSQYKSYFKDISFETAVDSRNSNPFNWNILDSSQRKN